MMRYEEALEILRSLGPELRTGKAGDAEPRKFSLEHIRVLLGAMSDPQTSFRSVLIAGTNGKGSTAATLASIGAAAGVRTGLYTSPHLLRVNERMRVSLPAADGVLGPLEAIPDESFGRFFGEAYTAAQGLVERGALPHTPSFFELLTATAFLFFAEQRVELAVLEVGLGGRLDATNVVEPIVSVITDIGIDHTEFLGPTVGAIAAEKAGILRPDGVLVTLSQHPEANAAIGERAMALNVRGVDAARCLPPRAFPGELPAQAGGLAAQEFPLGRNRYSLSLDSEVLWIDSPLAGHHQQRNLALAVATAPGAARESCVCDFGCGDRGRGTHDGVAGPAGVAAGRDGRARAAAAGRGAQSGGRVGAAGGAGAARAKTAAHADLQLPGG